MLSSMSYEVKFRVRVQINPGELVCVVGNCPELGNWEPQRAEQLRLETRNQTSHYESTEEGYVSLCNSLQKDIV